MLRADYTTEQVYKMIGPNARAAVDAARRYRANVAGVRALAELQPVMKAADAVKLGIYKQVNYAQKPTPYCGMIITGSPI